MNYKIKTLEKILDRKYPTIMVFLDRAEFQHIKVKETKTGIRYFADVSDEDLEQLKFICARKKKRGQWAYKKK
jgi:hypothetical protein